MVGLDELLQHVDHPRVVVVADVREPCTLPLRHPLVEAVTELGEESVRHLGPGAPRAERVD